MFGFYQTTWPRALEHMYPLCPVVHVNIGLRQFSELDCMINIRLDEWGHCSSCAVWAGSGGSGWVYLAVRRPGCVLQSCGWKSCAYLRRKLAGWVARAGGMLGGRRVAAPPAQRPLQTTSSGTGQSPLGLQLTSLQLPRVEAGMSGLHRTAQTEFHDKTHWKPLHDLAVIMDI